MAPVVKTYLYINVRIFMYIHIYIYMCTYISMQFIATSAEVTKNGGFIKESYPKWPKHSG